MKEEKIIKWQFAEGYYKYLLEKMRRIDYYLLSSMYAEAFRELKQIFIQINGPISNHNKDLYFKLSELLATIDQVNNNYQNAMLNREQSMQHLRIATKLKIKLEVCIYDFYMTLFKTIDDLNMLFPKDKKDNRLPIYQ